MLFRNVLLVSELELPYILRTLWKRFVYFQSVWFGSIFQFFKNWTQINHIYSNWHHDQHHVLSLIDLQRFFYICFKTHAVSEHPHNKGGTKSPRAWPHKTTKPEIISEHVEAIQSQWLQSDHTMDNCDPLQLRSRADCG